MKPNIESVSIDSTDYQFDNLKSVYHGKVRDVYDFGNRLAIVATDRISAFDHILPRPIPFKGQVLNQIATYFLEATQDICSNWLVESPDENVSIGIKCKPIKIEMVVRGYLAGHAWREYKTGKRMLCGVKMKDGMKEAEQFSTPIITPATKADEGHDEDISREEILAQSIVSEDIYNTLEKYSLKLFQRGTEMAADKGLILVDTKYEFGIANQEVVLIDEIHTPDSSRYYIKEGYTERQAAGEKQKQLSKEFVREWLMEHGFQGKEDQLMPHMPDGFIWQVSDRYIELFEILTGQTFKRHFDSDINLRIRNKIQVHMSDDM